MITGLSPLLYYIEAKTLTEEERLPTSPVCQKSTFTLVHLVLEYINSKYLREIIAWVRNGGGRELKQERKKERENGYAQDIIEVEIIFFSDE